MLAKFWPLLFLMLAGFATACAGDTGTSVSGSDDSTVRPTIMPPPTSTIIPTTTPIPAPAVTQLRTTPIGPTLATILAETTAPAAAEPRTPPVGPTSTPERGTPLTRLPTEPRTVDGRDFFDLVPRPDECDPAKDQSDESDYSLLSKLDNIRPVPNPYIGDEGFSLELTYRNEKGQEFTIVVSGSGERAVNDFVESGSSVCLEALPAAESLPPLAPPVLLDLILLDAVQQVTKLTLTELSHRRLEMSKPGFPLPTLNDILGTFGKFTDKVLQVASNQAQKEILAAVSDGGLTDAEGDVDSTQLIKALYVEPGAPFLYDPIIQPKEGLDYVRLLRDNPENLIITFEQEVPQRSSSMLWAAFDPPINRYAKHNFVARCSNSISTQVKARDGSMTVSVSPQNPYLYKGSARAKDPNQRYSDWVDAYSYSQKATFDSYVIGWETGSYYSIYGGWYRGSGGGC